MCPPSRKKKRRFVFMPWRVDYYNIDKRQNNHFLKKICDMVVNVSMNSNKPSHGSVIHFSVACIKLSVSLYSHILLTHIFISYTYDTYYPEKLIVGGLIWGGLTSFCFCDVCSRKFRMTRNNTTDPVVDTMPSYTSMFHGIIIFDQNEFESPMDNRPCTMVKSYWCSKPWWYKIRISSSPIITARAISILKVVKPRIISHNDFPFLYSRYKFCGNMTIPTNP